MTDLPKRQIAFILAATQHGAMLVNRHDYHSIGANTYGVGHQLLNTSSFDLPEVSTVLQLLASRRSHFGDGVVALDCGANIGVHTLEWAKLMHGWGEVTAFEAQERIFYALAGNLTLNNCFNARAVWAAVGAQSGAMKVPVPNYLAPASFGSLELRKTDRTEFIGQAIDYADQNMASTRMIAIDDLQLPRLDLVKIDIEGMEMEALLGAAASIERLKPQLVVEKIKSSETDLRAFVETRGYKVFPFGMNLLAIHHDDPACAQIKVG